MSKEVITYIGIDPGANGSMAFLCGDSVTVSRPLGKLTERDIWLELVEQPEPCRVLIEQVSPNRNFSNGGRAQGSSSMFTFGQGYGFLRGVAVASGFPFAEVRPQKWQPDMGIRNAKDESPTVKKNRHKAIAQQLFPWLKVTHAMADALLIAKYAQRNAEKLF